MYIYIYIFCARDEASWRHAARAHSAGGRAKSRMLRAPNSASRCFFTVSYEKVAGKTALLTWLRKMPAHSAGHNFTVIQTGSTNNSIASCKMEVFLASAMCP